MDESKGIAYCGLACCLCNEYPDCAGCKSAGCQNADTCKNYACCRKRGLDGCWQCPDFPCMNLTVDSVRTRSFVAFIAQYGERTLMDCLSRNQKNGMAYHYAGKLVGDYDVPDTQQGVWDLLLCGK